MSLGTRWQEIRTGFALPFWVANGTELFERLAYYGPQAVLAIYLHEHLGLTGEQAAWLIGYAGFITWFMPVVGGTLADRFGFRRTLVGAFLILAVGYFLLGSLSAGWMAPIRQVVPLFALMHVLMLVPALGPAVVKPVVVGTTARAAKENVRSMGYSIYYTVVNVGAAIGPLAASLIRTSVGVEDVFRVSAALTFVMAIAVLFFYKEPSREKEPQVASVAQAFKNLVKVLGNVRFVVFLLIFSGFWVSYWQQYLTLSIYWRDYVNHDTNVDRMLSIEALTVILTTFAVTYLMRKVPAFTAMIIGVLVSSFCWLVLTLGNTTPYLVVALVVLALGEVTQAPRYYEYVSRLAPPGQQGLFMGYSFLPIGIGYLGGGWLGGRLVHHFGQVVHRPAQMWYVVSAVGLAATLLMFVYNLVVKPGAQKAEASSR